MDSFEQTSSGKSEPDIGSIPMHRPAEPARVRADARRWWKVHCRDVVNAHRFLTVLINRDRVVLAGPPGESAVLSADRVSRLSSALRKAAEQARK